MEQAQRAGNSCQCSSWRLWVVYLIPRNGVFAHPTLAESLNNLFSTLNRWFLRFLGSNLRRQLEDWRTLQFTQHVTSTGSQKRSRSPLSLDIPKYAPAASICLESFLAILGRCEWQKDLKARIARA